MTGMYGVEILTRDSTEMWMSSIKGVGCGIVESKHNITLDTAAVVDEQVADRGTVWDEVHADALSRDGYDC